MLIDQNEDDRLAAMAGAWASRLRLERIVVPPRGVSQARNAGLARLQGESFIAFPDDDCCYEPDTLLAAEAVFERFSAVDVLIGDWSGIDERFPSIAANADVRFCNRYTVLRRSPTYALFFRRSAVDRVDSFDETLGPGGGTPWLCGEDTDYLLRAGGVGARTAFIPAVRVRHPNVEVAGAADKAFGYGRGRMRVLAKHCYPRWFQVASVIHPLVRCITRDRGARRFRWHLFRGRILEWLRPYRPERH
jgi:glycosyltransferase involved in cell wall biosynthesis